MKFSTLTSIAAGKVTNAIIKEFGLGSGSTWPGHIALKLNKTFLKDLTNKKNLKIVLIVGTNGKTTTAKLLRHILEKNGLKVFQNDEGANLINGIATSLLRNSTILNNIPYDAAIFEVDENNLPKVLAQINPSAIVFLNLFRDQLDRYGEVHTIASRWQEALKKVSSRTMVLLNADDPEIRYLLKSINGKSRYFSIPNKYLSAKKTSYDTDSTHCPSCGTKLKFSKIAYSHIGKYTCPKCKFTNENLLDGGRGIKGEVDESFPIPLAGTYNVYNTHAAVKTAIEVFNIPSEKIREALKDFKPAFGRQEVLKYKARRFIMLLSKNPAGFNQSISAIKEVYKSNDSRADQDKRRSENAGPHPNILIALNDRIPDGRDVSWIWDVDFEELNDNSATIMVTGDRAYEMGLRLKYSTESQKHSSGVKIFTDSKKAIDELVNATPEGELAFILPTYSAMLELRKILTGREIL